MITSAQAQPGVAVVHRPHPDAQAEDGVIIRLSTPAGIRTPMLAFVRWRDRQTPSAVRLADLHLAREEPNAPAPPPPASSG